MENRITFKNGYSLKLLTIKLLGSTENKIIKYKNSENLPHLEITEVVLVHCNIVNNDYQQDARVFYTSVPNKNRNFSHKSYLFKNLQLRNSNY